MAAIGFAPREVRTVILGIALVLAGIFGVTPDLFDLGCVAEKAVEYVRTHKRLLGSSYRGKMFLRPEPEVMAELKGTFGEFLDGRNMSCLKAVFDIGTVGTGFG